MARILDLPQELLVRIVRNLTTVQLGHVRCCNKQIEKLLFDYFAYTYFTKRQFMIEHPSLEALVGIASHPGLASHLQEVIISTHTLGLPTSLLGTPALANNRFVNSGYIFREQFIHVGLARDLLVEAFSRLPNVRTVGVRDYDGAGRAQDDGQWRSWGWSWGAVTDVHALPSSIFLLVLAALDKSPCRPANLEVFLHHHNKLGPSAFCLPNKIVHYLQSPPKSTLSSLKTLMLAISLPHEESNPWAGSLPVHSSHRIATTFHAIEAVQNFLHHTPNLETLRLNFDRSDDRANDLFRWLARRPQALTAAGPQDQDYFNVPPVSLPKLTTLDLGKVKTDPQTMVSVLARFELHSFSLWDVVLPRNQGLLGDASATLLRMLADGLPFPSPSPLRFIMIGRLAEDDGRGAPRPVEFVPPDTADKDREGAAKCRTMKFERRFTGTEAQEWLREAASLVYHPTDIEYESDESDESDEDYGQNEDEDQGDLSDGQHSGVD